MAVGHHIALGSQTEDPPDRRGGSITEGSPGSSAKKATAYGRLRPRPIAAAALVEVVEPRLDEGAPLAGEGLEPEPRPQRRHLCGNQISDAPPIDATLSP